MKQLNWIFLAVISVLATYIVFNKSRTVEPHFAECNSEQIQDDLSTPASNIKLTSNKIKRNVQPTTIETFTPKVVATRLNEGNKNKTIENNLNEEKIQNERNSREEKFWNSNYSLYFEEELREMAKEDDVIAQLVLSFKISEGDVRKFDSEGEYWARQALSLANKTGDETLFSLAVEQMSTFASLKKNRVEEYAWILLGAKRGSAMMKSQLDILRTSALNLNSYETTYAERLVPVLEDMLADNKFSETKI